MDLKSVLAAVLCLLACALLVQGQNDTRYDTTMPARRYKRKYGMCPPKFTSIGNECYFISPNQLNWLDAYFDCKDRNSKLAEPLMYEDKALRRALQKMRVQGDFWIGGTYNWKLNKWQWGHNGRDIEYQSFSQMVPGSSKDLQFHCALLKSDIKFRWSALPCTEKLNFVCQHRMPLVSESGRYMVYDKWNKTYPDQKAFEKLVYIVHEPNGRNRNESGKPRIYNSFKRVLQSNPSIQARPGHRNRNPNRARKPTATPAALRPNYIPPEVVGRKQHIAQYAPDTTNDIHAIDNGHRNGGGASYHHTVAHFNVDFSPRNSRTRNPSLPRGHRLGHGGMGRAEQQQHVPHQHRHQPGAHKPTKRTHYYVPPFPPTTTSTVPPAAPTTTTTTTTPPPPTTRTTARPTSTISRFPAYAPSTTNAHHGKYTTHAMMTAEEKRAKLRERLQKLTPEEQRLFFQDRLNRKKLRERQLRKQLLDRENEVVQ